MKLRTLIIDDEPIALEKLRSYVLKVPFLELVGQCGSGLEGIDFMTSNEVDLVITDINMPDLSGLELIHSLPDPPMVIFTTAYASYAAESYRVEAVDYLLKPYGFVDFQKAVAKAARRHDTSVAASTLNSPPQSGEASIFVKVDYRYVRVTLASIRYIKGYGEYLQLYVEGNASPLVTLSSFAALVPHLDGSFLQVHRSYVVNMNHVLQISRGRIVMDAETWIPVGDSFKAGLQTYLNTRSVGAVRKA